MELKTLNDLRIEEELCEKLDSEVYLPVKKELEGIGTTYSLGSRKEDFKGFIEKKLNDLRQEIIKWIKADIEVYKNADIQLPEGEQGRKIHNFIVERRQFWKDRFNITEEDVK